MTTEKKTRNLKRKTQGSKRKAVVGHSYALPPNQRKQTRGNQRGIDETMFSLSPQLPVVEGKISNSNYLKVSQIRKSKIRYQDFEFAFQKLNDLFEDAHISSIEVDFLFI